LKSKEKSSTPKKKQPELPKNGEMFKPLNAAETVNGIGWPKVTTDCSTRELLEKVEQATQEAVKKLKVVKSKMKSSKHRLEKGSLQKYIDAAKEKFCIPNERIISTNTVRQRVKRGAECSHVGQKSPMEDVEPYLVELIKKLASMRTPITTA